MQRAPSPDTRLAAGEPVVLRVQGLTKRFDDLAALDDVELRIDPGQIVAVIGPNGAGKTTLVSLVAGLLRPDGGFIEVDGVDMIRHPRLAQRSIALAPQETGLYPSLSVRENLEYFGRLYGLRGRELAARISWVVVAVGLDGFLSRQAAGLSGGEKRRVHTGIALLRRAPLILLDEPTTGADVESRQGLLALVKQLAAEGAGICYTTHYLPEVEALDATVVMIDGGVVIASGSVAELAGRSARGRLELRFAGAAPPTARFRYPASAIDRSTVALECDDPTRATRATMQDLGDDADRLVSLEIVRPGLEAVFRQLTSRSAAGQPDGAALAARS
jgi:ABC-2 type transport system ATP-binding protein